MLDYNKALLSKMLSWACCVLILCCSWLVPTIHSHQYEDASRLFKDLFGNDSAYNTNIAPVRNSSTTLIVHVQFTLMSIVSVDDKEQKLVVNGFLVMNWTDEMAQWSASDYGGVERIHPTPKEIWRPRMIFINTLGKRDLFEDDYSPVYLNSNGGIVWIPGCLFPVACKLNMRKFPFDKQTCAIQISLMNGFTDSVTFESPAGYQVDTDYAVESIDWHLLEAFIENVNGFSTSYFMIHFVLKRRPEFFVINVLLPVLVLSFLNNIVFVIPVESGEKISYGITVLLALALFMSTVSDMLPRSSDVIPLFTMYLLSLLVLSACTVVVAALTVWLHHKEEMEDKRRKARFSFVSLFKKVKILNKAFKIDLRQDQRTSNTDIPLNQRIPDVPDREKQHVSNAEINSGSTTGAKARKQDKNPENVNRYRIIGKHIDTVSFVVFFVIWCALSIFFLIAMTSEEDF